MHMCLFFFKQKTAYEMRISDWSSDVCSSDLPWDKPIDVVVDRLKESRAITRTMAYEDRRYIPAPGGVVAQHTMRRIRTDGGRVEIPALLRIFIQDRLIPRLNEYFEPAPTRSAPFPALPPHSHSLPPTT